MDADDNGQVEWTELVQFMGEVFMHIEREKTLQRALQQHAENTGIQDTAVPVTMDAQPAAPEAEVAVAPEKRGSQDVAKVLSDNDGQDVVQSDTDNQ